uniref:tRNA pseudouridylate synthase B C-terminal domain-containing protein n=1 Tax=Ditylum brightwellii TaxID=49249 RepID=A0A7S1ZFC1_9STRA|mmetsp:Transcript_30759/g.45884  ORF Transcript_30759/g.45884 Transcript_30759/m.45884 type:complete len:118 (+) Transcript_30759:1112-1465(+)
MPEIMKQGELDEEMDDGTKQQLKEQQSLINTYQNLYKPFGLQTYCGGGTYIRSLVRDIGRDLGTYATMISLVRTKQGPFELEHCLDKEDWNADKIYECIRASEKLFLDEEEEEEEES